MTNKFKSVPIKSSEITSHSQYLSRKDFLKTAGILTGSAFLAACSAQAASTPLPSENDPSALRTGLTDELGDPANTYSDITNYNNYYEFSVDKEEVAGLAQGFNPDPWTVEVTGLVNKPRTFGVDDLLKLFVQEERIYRLRCVEAWSMVIPWMGFPLASLLKEVEPTSDAKYVRFISVDRPEEMPGQRRGSTALFPWPYYEGLRMDEAMNDLTLLATGLYGETLPNQSGAPIRLVVPWKYGIKSIKAVTKIEVLDKQPGTLWSRVGPYGFYSNVNPDVSHWSYSQAVERRIGEFGRRETLMFNGYAEQVAHMYEGMDLNINF